MTGQRVADDIGGTQVRQDGLEYVAGAVVGGERTPSGGFGHLLKHGRARRLGAGRAQVHGIEQGPGAGNRRKCFASGGAADSVVAVGEQYDDLPRSGSAVFGDELRSVGQGIEKGSWPLSFRGLDFLLSTRRAA